MEVIASTTTPRQRACRARRGGSGDPSPWTALGVEAAIERLLRARLRLARRWRAARSRSPGLGHVGARVAKLCADGGATLLVTDIDRAQAGARRRARRALDRARRGADGARSTSSRRARSAACSTTRRVDAAAARRSSPARRTTSSPTTTSPTLLAARGVLWAPDFVVNAGGIINISVELEPGGYDPRRAARARARHRRHAAADLRRRRRDAASRRWPPRWRSRASGSPRRRPPAARRRSRAARGRLADDVPDHRAQPAGRRPRRALDAAGQRGPPRRACRGGRRASRSAARRRLGGASSQTRSSSSSTVAQAVVERGDEPPLAVERGGRGSGRAARPGRSTGGPWPGAQQREVQRAQALERREVAAQRARVGRDEDAALGEHGVAGEARRPRRRTRGGRCAWPGVATTCSGPNASPSASTTSAPAQRAARDRHARRRRRARPAPRSAWSPWSWVSAIPPTPPRAPRLGEHRGDVRVERRARGRRSSTGRARRSTCSCRSA